jgi:hypothetical protein
VRVDPDGPYAAAGRARSDAAAGRADRSGRLTLELTERLAVGADVENVGLTVVIDPEGREIAVISAKAAGRMRTPPSLDWTFRSSGERVLPTTRSTTSGPAGSPGSTPILSCSICSWV